MVGWKHMFNPETGKDFEFDKANLDLFVNPFEVQDLLERVLEAMQPTIEDKKKLDLSPPSEAV